jgi:CO dehydrogenase/acetyl-CoA synthase alpha subunit
MRLKRTKAFKTKDLVTHGSHMKIKLNAHLTEQVLALTNDYHYSPDELISMGIALAGVLLQEKALGNQVVVVAPNGSKVAEFKEVEPRAIHDMAKEYIQSICPGMAEVSAALLVAKLERDRDVERRR